MTKETIIKSTLKYLVKRQIEEGSVGFAVDNDHDHDCCWDDVLAWIEAQPSEEDFVKHKKEVLERIAKREREIDKYIKELETLKQQPSEDCVNRSELQRTMDSLPLFRFVNNDHEEADDYYNCESVDMVIRNLPSVTPQASEEDIHREREQAYMLGYEDASKKFRIEPCEDAVSRDVLTEYINTKLTSNEEWASDATNEGRWVEEKTYLYGVEILEGLSEYVNDLPSVKPKYTDEEIDKIQAVEQAYVDKMVELAVEETKRPKGHWIIIDDCELFMAKCSECGEIVDSRMINKYPYCHCGADMSGGGEDETDS